MANINLRPWREELRAEKRQQFLAMLGAAFVVAAGAVFIWDRSVNASISNQEERNAFVNGEIRRVDKKIKEIQSLQEKREQLLARMRVIQELQGNRPLIVRLFDDIVKTLPGGVFYKSLTRTKDNIKISGTAESNTKVSALLRNLDKSLWMKGPSLSGVKANPKFGDQANDFTLTVTRTSPNEEKASQETGEDGGA